MTPTRFKLLWRPRSKTRTRLQGRLFAIQMGTYVNSDSQSLIIERTITIDMRKAIPLALFGLVLAYVGATAVLHRWLDKRSSAPVAWSDCLLAPVRYRVLMDGLRSSKPSSEPSNPVLGHPASPADRVLTSARSRVETVENEDAFFQRLAANVKAGNDDEIISDINLARRRSPEWLAARQAELTQLEISIAVRGGDILALRSTASDYLNGNVDRAKVIITIAKKLHNEKFADAAVALVGEVRRKNPGYQPALELLAEWARPEPPQNPAAASTVKSVP